MRTGENQSIVIRLLNNMEVRGIAVVTSTIEGGAGYELTIPNMRVRIQDGRLVEHLKLETGQCELGMIGSGTLAVEKPLLQLAETPRVLPYAPLPGEL